MGRYPMEKIRRVDEPTTLIVEDEVKIARLVRDYLHQAGFDVLEATDGPSALTLARAEKPDMIVLDLGLPGMDGLDALRHVQSNPAYNLHLRQLLHVGYKVAAQMGDRYYNALKKYEDDVARNVTTNLWERHIKPLFLD